MTVSLSVKGSHDLSLIGRLSCAPTVKKVLSETVECEEQVETEEVIVLARRIAHLLHGLLTSFGECQDKMKHIKKLLVDGERK